MSDEPAKQINTLVNKLHSKEAQLNWMLEAVRRIPPLLFLISYCVTDWSCVDQEMEAQNTRTDENHKSGLENPAGRTTVTRTWAVETRLRKQFATIPQPLRAERAAVPAAPAMKDSLSEVMDQKPVERLRDRQQNVLAQSMTASTAVSEPSKTKTIDHRSAVEVDSASSGRVVSQRIKDNDSRHPSSTKQSETKTGVRMKESPEPRAPSAARRLAQRLFGKSSASSLPPATKADEPKSASILKLVNLSTGDSGAKTKDELVDEYKRARRVELEAMLRTMVEK